MLLAHQRLGGLHDAQIVPQDGIYGCAVYLSVGLYTGGTIILLMAWPALARS